MVLNLYNTLTRKKEVFKPLKGKKVNFFSCGPTTYNYIHIGNAKTYTQFDFIVKYLRYRKYKVFYLQNITDIDDKIINRAKEEKTNWKNLSKKYEEAYFEDIKNLNINSVNEYAAATKFIPQIVSQVKRLIDKRYAYKISDGYYYDISKFSGYGKLAKRITQETDDGVSRIDENPEKRNKGDFCLWKFKKENEPFWKTEIGDGRPGWHIEDTAITETKLGQQYDIHGGAVDLIFPHHEAEIAQMEAISGKSLVKYWMHTAFLNMSKEKMSKSKGNFILLRDLLKKYDSNLIRYFFISHHYRSSIEFSEELIDDAKNSLNRIQDFILKLKTGKDSKESDKILLKTKKEFINHLDDDFDTPKALAVLFNLIRDLNTINAGGKKVLKFFKEINAFFGFFDLEDLEVPNDIKELVIKREEARKNKDFKESDRLREIINKKGYSVEDTENRPVIKKL